MLQPIQKDHESCCPNCGCVLAQVDDSQNQETVKPLIHPSVDIALLGSACEKNIRYSYPRTGQQSREEDVLKYLENVIKKYDLPQKFIYETFNELKRRNRGFWSEKEPLKQLIKILSKDDNYGFFPKLNKIKIEYETILNR